MVHKSAHRSHRTGWLRAAVLGANDGIVSTASLVIGIAAADTSHQGVLLAGVAGMAAGALSMAAGEYVSVSSQADTNSADLAIEKASIENDPDSEKEELALIYQKRGLEKKLAIKVATQLMEYDALAAHARDDIGLPENQDAQPVIAAIYSACSFTIGASLPLSVVYLSSAEGLAALVAFTSLVFLGLLGSIGAAIGGASMSRGALRVMVLGGLAMSLTASVGYLFGQLG